MKLMDVLFACTMISLVIFFAFLTISLVPYVSNILFEKHSPFQRLHMEDIHIYDDKIIINATNASLAVFVDTDSMVPVIDYGSHAIVMPLSSPWDFAIGDIVQLNNSIMHRVSYIGIDKDGIYAKTKGDNNPAEDTERWREGDILGVVVAVIY